MSEPDPGRRPRGTRRRSRAARTASEPPRGGWGRQWVGARWTGLPERLPLVVVVIAALALVAGGYVLLRAYTGPPDYSGSGTGSVTVRIDDGATVAAIGATLERSGVVKSSEAFVRAAQGHPRGTSIQPGYYRLRYRMEANQALAMVLDPESRIQARVTIPEGTRMSGIFAIVAKQTDISVRQLQEAAADPDELGLPAYAETVEGYLFPATYTVDPNETAKELLRTMVDAFERTATALDLKRQADRLGMSPHEVVTIASLVQGEARRAEDFRKVAAVVYNRLDKGMRLEFDSTVNYVTGERTLQVSMQDIKVDSPYNTYRYAGLPPGPINSPGTQALRAALNPARGNWLYFVTTNPAKGITEFTSSYQEFLQFKKRFERNTG